MSDPTQITQQIAATWLSRRDRGLTASEQDEFLQWLRDDPSHPLAMGRLDRTWKMMDSLSGWQPRVGRPNRDLLALAGRRRWLRPALLSVFGAAAAVGIALYFQSYARTASRMPLASEARALRADRLAKPERMILPDGSLAELNAGAKLEVAFTPSERRVRLKHGEVFFTVAKNPARPFIVEAQGVAVRAVGTAFNVQLGLEQVAVLVTEGKVRVDQPSHAAGSSQDSREEVCLVAAGQYAVIPTTAENGLATLANVNVADIERALAWQGSRLQFSETPLSDVVAEFNKHNSRQLKIGDAAAGALRVGGNFRADNVDALVRLLESSFGIDAEKGDDGVTVLTLRH